MRSLFFTVIGWLFMSWNICCAQEFSEQRDSQENSALWNTRNQELHFYYIVHDIKTDPQRLCQELQKEYDNLNEYGNAGIFYLANKDKPMIVCVNMANVENDEDGTRFPLLIGEIQSKRKHDILVHHDIDFVMNLFERLPFLSEENELLYQSVNWNYYISSDFMTLGYNESIIATFYWTMDMDRLRKQEFYLNVMYSKTDDMSGFSKHIMGSKNLNGINDHVTLISY